MTRQEANRQLLRVLKCVVESEPDTRFSQALHNLGMVKQDGRHWVDEFYLEPED